MTISAKNKRYTNIIDAFWIGFRFYNRGYLWPAIRLESDYGNIKLTLRMKTTSISKNGL
jgi:hypothetical protein